MNYISDLFHAFPHNLLKPMPSVLHGYNGEGYNAGKYEKLQSPASALHSLPTDSPDIPEKEYLYRKI